MSPADKYVGGDAGDFNQIRSASYGCFLIQFI